MSQIQSEQKIIIINNTIKTSIMQIHVQYMYLLIIIIIIHYYNVLSILVMAMQLEYSLPL